MQHDIRVGVWREAWWTAVLSDGSVFCDLSPELVDQPSSAWLALEALAADAGETIAEANLQWGCWHLLQQSRGGRLVCGAHVDMEFVVGGGQRSKEYRFLLCELPERWVWTITDGIHWWEIVEPPGLRGHEAMPSVAGMEPRDGGA